MGATGRAFGRRLRSFGQPRTVVVTVIVALVALGLSYLVAVQDPVPRWELDLTDWINSVPDWVASLLYPIMQFGTLAGSLLAAGLILVIRRDWWLSGATIVAGLVTWFGAKGIKKVVERDRPLAFLPGIDVREGDGTGLGFISGHSAVAASAAVMLMVVLPRRWRAVPIAVAALVGIARIVHGVHLPADVVGGWAFGTLVSLAALWLLDLVTPSSDPVDEAMATNSIGRA